MAESPEAAARAPVREPRTVPAAHAVLWYREAMRLWKRGPFTFALLAFATLTIEFLLNLMPSAGVLLSQLVVPLTGCGLLYGSLAADRGGRPRLSDFAAILGASPSALFAVIASAIVVFAGEALTTYAIGRVNMLASGPGDTSITPPLALAIYSVGVAVSLPFTFVPFAALFDGLPIGESFAQSLRGFSANVAPMALYGLLSLALLLFCWVTFWLGLLLALPWWAASSYAAWKDIFAVGRGTTAQDG